MMKNIFYAIALGIALLFTSCQTPSSYEDEINDNVSYTIAVADFIINERNRITEEEIVTSSLLGGDLYAFCNLMGNDAYEDFHNRLDIFENDVLNDSCSTYRESLQVLSENEEYEYKNYATRILDNYNNIHIVLSEFEKVNDAAWKFSELNTGIEFIFTIEDEDWICYYTDDSWNNYVESYLQ